MYSIINSIKNAYDVDVNIDLKTEIFLTIYQKNKRSKEYVKILKSVSKLNKKIKALEKKDAPKGKTQDLLEEIEKSNSRRELLTKESKKEDKALIRDHELISKRVINRYRKGLVIVDSIKRINSIDSSYGRMVYAIFKELSKESIIENVKNLFGKSELSHFQQVIKINPKLKDYDFLDTEEGALLIESNFILFLMSLITRDLNEDEVKALLDNIVEEIGKNDKELKKVLKNIYKGGLLLQGFGKIILQIIRLSIGKKAFMNASVSIINIILRVILNKGMTFAQNAILRKYVARFLGSGPLAIAINIAMFIPDVASIVNKRDYFGITNVILLLYFLRNSNLQKTLVV